MGKTQSPLDEGKFSFFTQQSPFTLSVCCWNSGYSGANGAVVLQGMLLSLTPGVCLKTVSYTQIYDVIFFSPLVSINC